MRKYFPCHCHIYLYNIKCLVNDLENDGKHAASSIKMKLLHVGGPTRNTRARSDRRYKGDILRNFSPSTATSSRHNDRQRSNRILILFLYSYYININMVSPPEDSKRVFSIVICTHNTKHLFVLNVIFRLKTNAFWNPKKHNATHKNETTIHIYIYIYIFVW